MHGRMLRFHPVAPTESQVTAHSKFTFTVSVPDDALRTRLLHEIVFCRLNFPDCNTCGVMGLGFGVGLWAQAVGLGCGAGLWAQAVGPGCGAGL